MSRTVQLPLSSRLNATPLLQKDGTNTYYYGVWGVIDFPESPGDEFYRVKDKDVIRWDLLAYTKYGDYNKMWILWSVNKIIDPFNVPVNTLIRIPDPARVNAILGSIQSDAP